MSFKKLEHAIDLGQKLEHFFIAIMGADGFPYINSARGIEWISENEVAFEEWICPVTVRDLSDHPQIAILLWDPDADDGYEILGRVLMFESREYLNGYAPDIEKNRYLPQVKRRLTIRAEKILAFSHALRCDDVKAISPSSGGGMQSKEGSLDCKLGAL